MKFYARLLLLVSLISCAWVAQAKPEPVNLFFVKNELKNYHDSGEYQGDIARVINQARVYLAFRIHQNNRLSNPKKLAMVLDIDETSLSNYNDMVRLSFGGTPKEVDEAANAGHDTPITPTLALYNYAKENHVAVFFITGRHPNMRPNTVMNLSAAGFKNWDALYMKPMDYAEKSVVPYKSGVRKEIMAKGYDIVLNIGDQDSDLKGGYSDMAFKLPDPFYFIA